MRYGFDRRAARLAATLALSGCLPAMPDAAPLRGVASQQPDATGADAGAVDGEPQDDVDGPACPPALTGELVLNEIGLRPTGLDLDGDGKVSARDEYVEIVSNAPHPVGLAGVTLHFAGQERGVVVAAPCLAPRHAALLVGSTTAPFLPPAGSLRVALDRTLRLTDAGGRIALRSLAGGVHDAVDAPAAAGTGPHVWARRADGQFDAPFAEHGWLGPGRAHSPGVCLDGSAFPHCPTW